MVHFVQNPRGWLAGRIFGFLISVGAFLFLDFAFNKETTVASEKGWVLGFSLTQVLLNSLSILLCLTGPLIRSMFRFLQGKVGSGLEHVSL